MADLQVPNSESFEQLLFQGPAQGGVTADWLQANIDYTDWYKTFAYQFVIEETSDSPLAGPGLPSNVRRYLYTLPIPPQAFQLSPVSTSSVTPTLGGVVEETSPTVFWDISMSGTMGVSASRSDITKPATVFRDVRTSSGPLSRLISNIEGAAQSITDAAQAVATFNQDTLNAVNDQLQNTSQPFNRSAVSNVNPNNGYTETHLLHKFFLTYIRLKGLFPNRYKLYFRNTKDNQQWQVIFSSAPRFEKSAGSPYKYNYAISLRGWSMTSVSSQDRFVVDRFSSNGDLYRVRPLISPALITATRTALQGLNALAANPFATLVRSPLV